MRILMVEDNEKLCAATAGQLGAEGYQVDLCHDGEDALYYLREGVYDLILLDRMLPGMDGMTLLRKAREEGVATPVLMLTAMGDIDDKVEGLNAGADDYLAKPFDARELLARVRALTRRPAELEQPGDVVFGDLRLDTKALVLQRDTTRTTLSKKEAELLEVLMRHGGETLSRETLFAKVWGVDTEVEEANLASYILFARKRLKTVGSRANLITVRGVGYRLEDAPC